MKANFHLRNYKKWDDYIFWFAVIDILFLPYFWLVSVPLSLPLVLYWAVKRKSQFKDSAEYKIVNFMFILMIFSTIIGSVLHIDNTYENVIFLVKYYYIFMVYFLFKFNFTSKDINLKKILMLFVVFVLVLAIAYYVDKNLYQSIKTVWNYRSNFFVSERYIGLVGYRYSFIWMDPNNIGYMLSSVVFFLFTNEKVSFFTKIILLISLIVVLISTMSNGAFLALIITFGTYITLLLVNIVRLKIKTKTKPINVILLFASLFLVMFTVPQIPNLLGTNTAIEAIERIQSNSGDSRFLIWTYILENTRLFEYLLLFFIGKGGVTLVGVRELAPHNGHLYWILGYGFISYLAFIYVVFRKRKNTPFIKYIWIIPVLIGFTINTMIGEMKLFGLLMLLVAKSGVTEIPNHELDTKTINDKR